MSYFPSARWVPPARSEDAETHAETNEDRIAAAALLGAAYATEDVFPIGAPDDLQHLLLRGADPTDPEKNILGTFAWSVRTHIASAIGKGEHVTAQRAYRAVRDKVIARGPSRIHQLPRTLPAGRTPVSPGTDVVDLLTREWRRQVGDLLDTAWETWQPALDRRTSTRHPLVRVACLARGGHDPWELHTLLGLRHVTYLNADTGAYAVSALVHPNEAEHLLDGWDELDQKYRLLPSAGVSQARIDTAMRLRHGVATRKVDPPMRALAAALTAAADVLGEPVNAPVPAPSTAETLAALHHLSTLDARAPRTRPARAGARPWSAA